VRSTEPIISSASERTAFSAFINAQIRTLQRDASAKQGSCNAPHFAAIAAFIAVHRLAVGEIPDAIRKTEARGID
jgi:hypothetical protein